MIQHCPLELRFLTIPLGSGELYIVVMQLVDYVVLVPVAGIANSPILKTIQGLS